MRHEDMDIIRNLANFVILLFILAATCIMFQFSALETAEYLTAELIVDAFESSPRKIPETLYGVFFEEINHAGAGGLWAEFVNNRGFEAGGPNTPSNIDPWIILGNESSLAVSTDRSSCFDRNKVALRMDVLCNSDGVNLCPTGGVGIYNPGFWGMNIEQGKTYKVVLFIRSLGSVNMSVSLTGSNGFPALATTNIIADNVLNWTKMEAVLQAKMSDSRARLQLTTTREGTIWFDQVSVMPSDTYKGHGFRNDLFRMIQDLRPGFIRFPGGCFVEGSWLRNAFRWKETVGPWEERPGHFGDVWNYWTDDGLGHYELFQLAEDLGAAPIWVFNNGVSLNDEVDTSDILPFVDEILDGIEFARGESKSKWGSIRAAMGHPKPFDLRYVAVGNENCGKRNYIGNYLKFYSAIKKAYPDITIIINCDGSDTTLNHPADFYDYHIYNSSSVVFSFAHKFDHSSRTGPKAFVSEYGVIGMDAGEGSLLAALAEAGFLIGLERNSDVVAMASYAPLLVNTNDRTWSPDAIVFDSSKSYGTPSYWMQHFFKESNGATLLNSTLITKMSKTLIASAITWQNPVDNLKHLTVKVLNYGSGNISFKIDIRGMEYNNVVQPFRATKTVLTSDNVMDENSFALPDKVVPITYKLESTDNMQYILLPYSFTSFDYSFTSFDFPSVQLSDGTV